MKKNNGKKRPLLIFIVLTLTCTMLLVFKLFEPIFVHKQGWTNFQSTQPSPIATEYFGEQWRSKSLLAKEIVTRSYSSITSPALSVAVSANGEIAWRAAIGYADLENLSPITFEHAFRIGSTSKAITSVAIGRLVDQGKLEFDAKIQDLDPSLSDNLKGITLKHALSHRTGIRNYGMCFCFPVWEHLNGRHFDSVRDSVKVIEGSPLQAKPGENFSYTSLGFNLAGLAVAKSTGESFPNAVKEHVLTPLNMQHTYLEDGTNPQVLIAKPYDVENSQYKPTFPVDQSIRLASGGFLSTPSDMLNLGNSMVNQKFLSNAVREKLLTVPEQGRSNGGQIYALGWRVSNWKLHSGDKIKSYHHNGVSVGGVSMFIVFPEQNMVISAMINKNARNSDDLKELVKELVAVFLDGE